MKKYTAPEFEIKEPKATDIMNVDLNLLNGSDTELSMTEGEEA
jgi:hypothetical protein